MNEDYSVNQFSFWRRGGSDTYFPLENCYLLLCEPQCLPNSNTSICWINQLAIPSFFTFFNFYCVQNKRIILIFIQIYNFVLRLIMIFKTSAHQWLDPTLSISLGALTFCQTSGLLINPKLKPQCNSIQRVHWLLGVGHIHASDPP